MDAELYARVRKLEKQVEALLERHPEVRAVLQRDLMMKFPEPERVPAVVYDADGNFIVQGTAVHHQRWRFDAT